MGDTAARAEARRRRILENSQKRLEKITGRAEKPILENGVSDGIGNINTAEDTLDNATIFTAFQERLYEPQSSADYITEDTTGQTPPSIDNQKETTTKRIHTTFKSNVCIVLLAVFTYLVQLMTNKVLTNYFFFPLIIFEITMYFSFDQMESNSLLKTLLALSGIAPRKLRWIFMIISFIQKTSQDACLYLFTYVIAKLFIESVV